MAATSRTAGAQPRRLLSRDHNFDASLRKRPSTHIPPSRTFRETSVCPGHFETDYRTAAAGMPITTGLPVAIDW